VAAKKSSKGFTDAEKSAMRERAAELKAEARASKNRAEGEADLLSKISKLPEPDRSMAKRLHAIVTAAAPSLMPKTWYGMPAYAKDEKVLCFFQPSSKFGTRYSSFGFNDIAKLDDGAMWPVAFALKSLAPAEEARIAALVKKAVSA
jgi:uncharacterized protein YdhG (YjbR/CyaY superfamily)